MPRRTQDLTRTSEGEADQDTKPWAEKEDAWAFQRESADSELQLVNDAEDAEPAWQSRTDHVQIEAMELPDREIDLTWNEAFERASIASRVVILAQQRVQEAWQAWSTPDEVDMVYQARREAGHAIVAERDAWDLAWDAFQAIDEAAGAAEAALARGEINRAQYSRAMVALVEAEPKIESYRVRAAAQAAREADGD